ncbi:MAG: hypothetical protein K6G45_05385 [Lachnospiraceae bacterium]|nr:hypothetical protein [Lachnospiraceae bacterium]
MRHFYEQINQKLNTIDFDVIYPGFHKYNFALYNDETIWFEDREIPQQGFFGNTAKEYEGEYIAIWYVDRPADSYDLDEFTAGIVHEMFHAFQYDTLKNAEFPDDLKLLQYPDDEENYLLKQNENELLAESADADPGRKAEILRTVLASRTLRELKIGEIVHQEDLIEKFEGQAECSGLLALKQLSEEKFDRKIRDYAGILNEGTYLFDARRNGYFSGTLIKLLERENMGLQSEIKNKIESERTSKQQKFDTFFSGDTEYHEASGYICGYDPMNQIRLGDRLWAKHFMAINVNGEVTQMHEQCVVEMQEGSPNLTKGYWKLK